jgi:LPS-assembly protein
MKNKTFFIILFLIFCKNISYAQDMFNFETKSIEIVENGNLINASNGKAVSSDKNIEVIADNFQYSNDSKILKINGNASIFIISDNLKIKFDKGVIDQNKFTFEALGTIEAEDLNQNININSKKIIFNDKDKILFSPFESIIKDNYGNVSTVDNFKYEIKKDLLRVKNLNLIDKDKNNLKLSLAYINTKTSNLYGKDAFVNLNNETFNENSEPRLKGNSIINNDVKTEIKSGVFTTCKKRDDCPPWELTAEKITHDKTQKVIRYENAFLKIYDKPVVYFPKFKHPDPTVEKQSGFLAPSIKSSSNKKNFLSLPYYLAISDNKDTTFSPRFYDHEEFLLQTEYRQANYKSNHISDFSFKIDEDQKLKSHFFYKYNKNFNLDNFIESDVALQIQTTSKDTYLKKNKIKANLSHNNNVLESSAKISLINDNSSTIIETIIYEDLNKDESNRFEYIVPKIDYEKELDNKTDLNGNFTLNSQALTKNYNTNILEKINVNDLNFKSIPQITDKGFYNNYEFIIKNSNTSAKNSKDYKNKDNVYLSGLLQYNSSLPLVKDSKNFKKILNPKLALKLAPNYTKDYRNQDIKIDIDNIYSLNRVQQSDMVEGGLSLTYGNDFSIFDKKNLRDTFNFKIANNFRLSENKDLPTNSQIGQKTSSIVNEISYKPSDMIKLEYNSSIKNNLTDINYENLITEFKVNNLVTSFEYLNQNNSPGNNDSFLSNKTELFVNDSNSFSFSTRRNKTIDLTEYYNLAYQYKNDCLTASIEYNKEYYSDKDIRPNESLLLNLKIIPFNRNDNLNF